MPYNNQSTVAPAAPQPTAPAPVTHVGRGGIPVPLDQPGPRVSQGAPGSGGQRGAAIPPAPRITGAAPISQAAQAAAPAPAGSPGVQPVTLPVTEVLPAGIVPYTYGGQAVNGRVDPGSLLTGYKFVDPNTGRENGFPTLQGAQAALGTAGTPAGVEQAQAGLLDRIRNVGGSYTSAEGFPQNEQESRTQTTAAEDRLLGPGAALVAPALDAVPRPAVSSSRPAQNAIDRGFAPNEKIEIIRGLDSQIFNTNPQGKSFGEVYREQLNDSINSNLSAGRPALDAHYSFDENGKPHRLQTRYDTLRELEEQDRVNAAPISLDRVKANRASELTRNPGGINEGDKLLFNVSQPREKPQIYTQKLFDDPKSPGFQTGETPYAVDDRGNATPLNLQGAQPSGAAAQQARANAMRSVKLGRATREQVNERLRKAGYPEI